MKRAPSRAARAEKAELPQFIAPQLATLVTEPPTESKNAGAWVYEVKRDGYRMLARISAKEARLFTRTGREWTEKLPRLAAALAKLRLKESWLDGEIVVPGPGGRSSFQALQNAFEAGRDADIVYYVFDAPFLSGQDLRRLPLMERKKRLAKALKNSTSVRISEHLKGQAKQVLDETCKLGLEGLIGKQADSVYVSGRAKSWIKLKCRQRQDFVIGGYTPPGGSRHGFGALLVGFYDAQGKLQYAGKVGTGFDEKPLRRMTRRLASLKKPEPPFENPPREKGVQWVRPALVAEVAFTERTNEGILRQASFMGLREDLPAKSVGLEKAQTPPSADSVLGVVITHPDRLIWPKLGITKIDLARYIEAVGEWLLPHVKNRPLSLVRCPDGAEGQCFYQRHLMRGRSPGSLQTVRRERSGAYIYAASLDAVVSAVQNGAIEFHTWGATVPELKHPDRITLDLDPDENRAEELPEDDRRQRPARRRADQAPARVEGGQGVHAAHRADARQGPPRPLHREDREAAPPQQDLCGLSAQLGDGERRGRVLAACASQRRRLGAAIVGRAGPEERRSRALQCEERARAPGEAAPRPWADYAKTRQSLTAKMKKALKL